MEAAVIGGYDAARFLPSMLEGIKAKISQRSGVSNAIDTEDTTFISYRFQLKTPFNPPILNLGNPWFEMGNPWLKPPETGIILTYSGVVKYITL
jgi:hypothetical protein